MMRRFFTSTIRDSSPTFGLLLDDYGTDAFAAHSVRLLSSTYFGNCVQVKRDSDSALLDIGFVDGLLDTASMLTFAGAGTIRYERFYDQTGNGNDLIRASTLGSIAVNSGVLVEDSGIPAAENPTSNNYRYTMAHAGELDNTASKSVFIVVKTPETNKSFHSGTRGTSGQGWMFRNQTGNSAMQLFFTGGLSTITQLFTKTVEKHLFALTHTDVALGAKLYHQNNLIGEGRPTGGTNRTPYEWNNDNGVFGVNWLFEHVVYSADKNLEKDGISDNMNNYYSIY